MYICRVYVNTRGMMLFLSPFSLLFLLFIFSVPEELDPTRVCKGKGAVTLRATLVHVDDGDCITQEQDVNPAKSE